MSFGIQVSEAVEVWLNDLAKSMVGTLKSGLPGCIKAKDFKTHPSQLLNLAEMVTFTSKAESAIQRNALPQLQKDLRALLAEYTSADYTGYRVMQLKLQALVLDLIHNIEIVEQLISSRCQVRAPSCLTPQELLGHCNKEQVVRSEAVACLLC